MTGASLTDSTAGAEPVVDQPHLLVANGEQVVVSHAMLGVSDSDTAASGVTITVESITHGHFTLDNVTVDSFTLADVDAGRVSFVHDGSGAAPSFAISASDGSTTTAAVAGTVTYATIAGTSGAEVLTGTAGDDLIAGHGGNDTIVGGQGNDIMVGHNSASDTNNVLYVWNHGDAGTAGAKDVIRDFHAWNGTSGDKLDIGKLLDGYVKGSSDIAQWVSVQTGVAGTGTEAGHTGTLVTIDVDGSGAGTVTQTVFLTDTTIATTDVHTLASSGVIVA